MRIVLALFVLFAAVLLTEQPGVVGQPFIELRKSKKDSKGLKHDAFKCGFKKVCVPKVHKVVIGKECAEFKPKKVCDSFDVQGCLKRKKFCTERERIPKEKCVKWVNKCEKKEEVCTQQIDKCIKKEKLFTKHCIKKKKVCAEWDFKEEKVCLKYKCVKREKLCKKFEKRCVKFKKFKKCGKFMKKCGKFAEHKAVKCLEKKSVCKKVEIVKHKVCKEKALKCIKHDFKFDTMCGKWKNVCSKRKVEEKKVCVSTKRFCEKYIPTGQKLCKEWGVKIHYKNVCAVEKICKEWKLRKAGKGPRTLKEEKKCIRERQVIEKKEKFCKLWEFPTKCAKFTSKCTEFKTIKEFKCIENKKVCVEVKKFKREFCKEKKLICIKTIDTTEAKCVKKKEVCVKMQAEYSKVCAKHFDVCKPESWIKWKRCQEEKKFCALEAEGGCIKYDKSHCLVHKTLKHVFCKKEAEVCAEFGKKFVGFKCTQHKKFCVKRVRKCLKKKLVCEKVKKWFVVGRCLKHIEKCVMKGPIKSKKCQKFHIIHVCVKHRPTFYHFTTVDCHMKKLCTKCPVHISIRPLVTREITTCRCGKCKKKLVKVKVEGIKKMIKK